MNNKHQDRIDEILATPEGRDCSFVRGLCIGLAIQLDTAEQRKYRPNYDFSEFKTEEYSADLELADQLKRELMQ